MLLPLREVPGASSVGNGNDGDLQIFGNRGGWNSISHLELVGQPFVLCQQDVAEVG